MAAKPKVVVVGGGPGGASVAKFAGLAAIADVTLVDTKEYMEVNPATLRAFVEPSWANKIIWKHESYLQGKAKLVVGAVSRVEANTVSLENGQTLPFDYIVVASGSSTAAINKSPSSRSVTVADRLAWFRAEAEKIAAAKNILIVGGGAVGVEFAGEILTDMPGKKVTLVQSGPALFAGGTPKVPDSYANGALKWLTSHGATVILNDRVDTKGALGSTPGASFVTQKGVSIAADYVFMSIGAPPNTSFYDPSKLDNSKRIVVDEFLRVKGAKGHYAIGDCAASGEKTYAYFAQLQGQLTAKNIIAAIKGQSPVAYKMGPNLQVLSLGRNAGRCLLPFGECSGCCAVSMKSKDLAIGIARKEFGQPS